MTAFWRALGDPVSRLDRFETAMNLVPPGEERDTTSPEAMARSVARFVLGDVLTPASRASLRDWMERTATGSRRIRAALPAAARRWWWLYTLKPMAIAPKPGQRMRTFCGV